jgi:hypothetical protein
VTLLLDSGSAILRFDMVNLQFELAGAARYRVTGTSLNW